MVNNRYRLLGLRVQFKLKRGANGTHTDYIQAALTFCRLAITLGRLRNSCAEPEHQGRLFTT